MTNTPTSVPKSVWVKVIIALVLFVVLFWILAHVQKGSPLAIWCAAIAGALLLAKEIVSAFARDRRLQSQKDNLENIAVLCSLFGTAAAIPAVFIAIS